MCLRIQESVTWTLNRMKYTSETLPCTFTQPPGTINPKRQWQNFHRSYYYKARQGKLLKNYFPNFKHKYLKLYYLLKVLTTLTKQHLKSSKDCLACQCKCFGHCNVCMGFITC